MQKISLISRYLFVEIILLLLICVILFILSFQYFILNLPDNKNINLKNTDAIIVATGGVSRIDEGLKLLSLGVSNKMLLTGGGEGIKKQTLIKNFNIKEDKKDLFFCCVELDYSAQDTKGNAIASLKWIKKNKVKNIRLVTANYHFPRAFLEFEKKLKDHKINIEFWPIEPKGLKTSIWYFHWPSGKLLFREYLKYIFALLSSGIS